MAGLLQWVRTTWHALTAPPARDARPDVVVHDPDSQRPHDLDDPFFDPAVQSRIAGVIADSAKKKD
jgi:hypothetical protein